VHPKQTHVKKLYILILYDIILNICSRILYAKLLTKVYINIIHILGDESVRELPRILFESVVMLPSKNHDSRDTDTHALEDTYRLGIAQS